MYIFAIWLGSVLQATTRTHTHSSHWTNRWPEVTHGVIIGRAMHGRRKRQRAKKPNDESTSKWLSQNGCDRSRVKLWRLWKCCRERLRERGPSTDRLPSLRESVGKALVKKSWFCFEQLWFKLWENKCEHISSTTIPLPGLKRLWFKLWENHSDESHRNIYVKLSEEVCSLDRATFCSWRRAMKNRVSLLQQSSTAPRANQYNI